MKAMSDMSDIKEISGGYQGDIRGTSGNIRGTSGDRVRLAPQHKPAQPPNVTAEPRAPSSSPPHLRPRPPDSRHPNTPLRSTATGSVPIDRSRRKDSPRASAWSQKRPRPAPSKRARAFGRRFIVDTAWERSTNTSAGHHAAGDRGGSLLCIPRRFWFKRRRESARRDQDIPCTDVDPTPVRGSLGDSRTQGANPSAFDLNREQSGRAAKKPPRTERVGPGRLM